MTVTRFTQPLEFHGTDHDEKSHGRRGVSIQAIPLKGRGAAMKAIKAEMDAQEVPRSDPIRSFLESKGTETAFARNASGKIIGAIHYDVRKRDRDVTVVGLRVRNVAKGSGTGTELMRHAARIAVGMKGEMKIMGAVQSAKPFYSKIGAIFSAPDLGMGRWSDESLKKFADGGDHIFGWNAEHNVTAGGVWIGTRRYAEEEAAGFPDYAVREPNPPTSPVTAALEPLEFHLPGEHDQKKHGRRGAPSLEVKEYEGRLGDRSHITRSEMGTVPVSAIAALKGASGEFPGEHRNRQGPKWDAFLDDIRENGIKNPIFVTVDYDEDPKISEGNHRRDAAVELGLPEVPVEIRYFGKAEEQGSLTDRTSTKDRGHQFGKAPISLLTEHPALTEIISRFKRNRIPLYVVGGPVRDLLSEGHPGLDLDMTTPADVPTIKRMVNDLGALAPAGEEYGTVKLIRVLPDGARWEVEITQHRGEVYDTDSRKPTVAPTTDLSKDLGRRDFTLNSLALDTATGKIIDQHGGIADLRNGVLRTPLDPEKTFSDDPLRILRLVRFSATRGLIADESTHEAARRVAPRMSIVSPERRLVELQKILKSPRPEALTDALRMSESLGLDDHLFSGFELAGPRQADLTNVRPSGRLAALTFTTPDVKKALFNLKVKNETIKHVTAVHTAVTRLTHNPALAVRKHSDAELQDAAAVAMAFGRDIHPAFHAHLADKERLRRPLPVTGRDAPDNIKGREIGEWLSRVEQAFLLNPDLTKEQAVGR